MFYVLLLWSTTEYNRVNIQHRRIITEALKIDKKLWPEMLEESTLVKVGIVGEIYTVLEPTVNKNTVEKIRKMGALVHNSLPLSYFLLKPLYNRGWLKRTGVDRKAYKRASNLKAPNETTLNDLGISKI